MMRASLWAVAVIASGVPRRARMRRKYWPRGEQLASRCHLFYGLLGALAQNRSPRRRRKGHGKVLYTVVPLSTVEPSQIDTRRCSTGTGSWRTGMRSERSGAQVPRLQDGGGRLDVP